MIVRIKKLLSNHWRTVIAFLLLPVLIVSAMPQSVKAAADSIKIAQNQSSKETETDFDPYANVGTAGSEASGDEAYIIAEDETKRELSEKHFVMSDGTMHREAYAVPVHYMDADGKYQDIDNSLIVYAEDGEQKVKNAGGTINAEFSMQPEADKPLFSASSGEYRLDFELSDENTTNGDDVAMQSTNAVSNDNTQASGVSKKAIINPESKKAVVPKEKLFKSAKILDSPYIGRKLKSSFKNTKLDSSLKYENLYNGADFEYSVEPNRLKENIIVHSPQEVYDYTFLIRADGLYLYLWENGEITARAEDGTIVYTIPAPYMFDSANVRSDEVYYTLTKEDEFIYIMTISASSAWANSPERIFPITIDPIIEYVHTASIDFFTYKTSNLNQNYPSDLVIIDSANKQNNYLSIFGTDNTSNLRSFVYYRTYINISNSIPSAITGNIEIKGSSIRNSVTTDELRYDVMMYSGHKYKSSRYWERPEEFSEDNLVNAGYMHNDFPQTVIVPVQTGQFGFCIKSFVDSRFNDRGYSYVNISDITYVEKYREIIGLHSSLIPESFSNDSFSLGVNMLGLKPTVSVNLVSAENPVMSVDITAYYNFGWDAKRTKISNNISSDVYAYYGADWKLNVEQYMIPGPLGSNGPIFYEYVDATGASHYLFNKGNYQYESRESGLKYSEQGFFARRLTSDSFVGYMIFDNYGRLYKHDNGYNNYMKLEYNGTTNRIAKIKYGKVIGNIETFSHYVHFNYSGMTLKLKKLSCDTNESGSGVYQTELTYTTDYNSIGINWAGNISNVSRNGNPYVDISYSSSESDQIISRITDRNGNGYALSGTDNCTEIIEELKTGSATGSRAELYLGETGNSQTIQNMRTLEFISADAGISPSKKTYYLDRNGSVRSISSGETGEDKETVNVASTERVLNESNALKYSVAKSTSAEVGEVLLRYGEATANYSVTKTVPVSSLAAKYIDPCIIFKLQGCNNSCEAGLAYRIGNGNWVTMYPKIGKEEKHFIIPVSKSLLAVASSSAELSIRVSHSCSQFARAKVLYLALGEMRGAAENYLFEYPQTFEGHELHTRDTLLKNISEDVQSYVHYRGSKILSEKSVTADRTYKKTYNYANTNYPFRISSITDTDGYKEVYDYSNYGTYNSTNSFVPASFPTAINAYYYYDQIEKEKYIYDYYGGLHKIVDYLDNNRETVTEYIRGFRKDTKGTVTEADDTVIGEYVLNEVKYNNVTQEKYLYDDVGRIKKVTNGMGEVIHNYSASGTYDGMSYGGNTFGYNYNTDGSLKGIKNSGGNEYITYGYNQTNGALGSKSFMGGDRMSYGYTGGKMTSKDSYNGSNLSQSFGYSYDGNSLSGVSFDGINKSYGTATRNNYSRSANISASYSMTGNGFDYYSTKTARADGRESGFLSTINGLDYNRTETYDNRGRIYETYNGDAAGGYNPDIFRSEYQYNSNGTIREYILYSADNVIHKKTYDYEKYGGYYEDPYYNGRLDSVGAYDLSGKYSGENFRYDRNGNIENYTLCTDENHSYYYYYDNAGRLDYWYNSDFSYYEEYDYDNANNISYIRSSDTQYQEDYFYNNGNILYYYQNEDSTNDIYDYCDYAFDNYGRMISRTNQMDNSETSYFWTRGTMLSGYQKSGYYGDVTNSYSYDENGMRYRKETMQSDDYYGDSYTERLYYYDGDRLIAESINGNIVYYYYDATGVIGMCYNNTNYYFLKNQFGDILYIVGVEDGEVYGEYQYDLWGRVTIVEDIYSEPSEIARINPFRYRGYYYDTETELYYLQTRYYDPMIRRFISADNYELTPQLTTGELNMYAYCANNPIMFTDPSGESITALAILATLLIGTGIGAFAGGMTAYATGQNFWVGVAGGAVSGFISTFGMALAVTTGGLGGLAVAAGFGFASGFGGSIITQGIDIGWSNLSRSNWNSALISGVVSAAISVVSYGMTNFAMREAVDLFDNIFDESLTFGARLVNSLAISGPALIATGWLSAPFTFMNSLVDLGRYYGSGQSYGNYYNSQSISLA